MSRKGDRTSKAVILSARFNPIERNPRESKALARIRELEGKGFNFKQIVVDAILRADGATPEMFDKDTTAQPTLDHGDLLEQIIRAVKAELAKIGTIGIVHDSDDSDPSMQSEDDIFLSTFVRSMAQRQQMLLTPSDDDDE